MQNSVSDVPLKARLFLALGALLTTCIAPFYKVFISWMYCGINCDTYWNIFNDPSYPLDYPSRTFVIILMINLALFWNIIFFGNSKKALGIALGLPYVLSLLSALKGYIRTSGEPNSDLVFLVLLVVWVFIFAGNIFQGVLWTLLLKKQYLLSGLLAILVWVGLLFYIPQITRYILF